MSKESLFSPVDHPEYQERKANSDLFRGLDVEVHSCLWDLVHEGKLFDRKPRANYEVTHVHGGVIRNLPDNHDRCPLTGLWSSRGLTATPGLGLTNQNNVYIYKTKSNVEWLLHFFHAIIYSRIRPLYPPILLRSNCQLNLIHFSSVNNFLHHELKVTDTTSKTTLIVTLSPMKCKEGDDDA